MKNKILYLTTTSKISGAEKMLYELAKRINKEKYEVAVCTITDDLEDQLLDKLKKEGVKTYCLNLNKKWKIWKSFKLYRIIKSFKPEIIQSFLFFDNILARVFGKITGVPFIISGQRNVETHRSFLRNFFDKITIPFSDLVISNTKEGKEILIKREKAPEEKIKVIYNGIDIKEDSEKIKLSNLTEKEIPDKIKIGFIGRLTKQKGLDYLLKAVSNLKEEIILIIIGEGEEKERLEKKAKELQIEAHFTGYVKNASSYIKFFDLFVLSSLWEGMPNVILEAMSQEVPVIATKVGGVKEMVKNNKTGFLIESQNSKELKEKIEHVLSLSNKEREEIGKKAREFTEKEFSIEKMVKEYEKIYEKR